MTKKRLIVLAVALAIVGVFLIGLGIRKTVIVNIDGRTSKIETSALTVAGVLSTAGISINEQDIVTPSPSSWIFGDASISIETASWMTIYADGKSQLIFSVADSPDKMLTEAGIRVDPGDQIIVNGKMSSPDKKLQAGKNHSIQVLRSKTIQLETGGQVENFSSTQTSLGAALWDNGIEINNADRLTPPAETRLQKPLKVNLSPSREIVILSAGSRLISRSAAGRVGEVLAESGIPLQGLDYSIPGWEDPTPEDGAIQVVRVNEEVILESEPIPFTSESQPVPDLEIDNTKIVQSGQFGLNTKRIRIRHEDGVEVSRQIEAEYISQEPQSEIIGFGTQITPKTLDTPGGQITYWRALNMYAISYNVTSSGGDGITATGIPLQKGVVAIDPRIIPYGTRMYVPGYGEALAADTGGGIRGRMIDLGYRDEDYVSWHEWVTVYFLWPPPENVVWIIP